MARRSKSAPASIAAAITLIAALLPLNARADDNDDIDLILTPRLASSPDMRINGFAGAGCGLLEGISGIYANPALPHAFGTANPSRHFVIEAGYGRDRIYSQHIIPAGASCMLGKEAGTVGLLYRYLRSDEERSQHEAVLNYSSRLFEKSTAHGAVDYGVNIRYERANWQLKSFDSIPSIITRRDSTQYVVVDTTWSGFDGPGAQRDNRLLLDIGFYQAYIAERLDFGLTFTNLLGYVWRERHPYTREFPYGDSTYSDSTAYVDATERSEGWIDAAHRCLSVGVAFKTPILSDNVKVIIPFDLEFLGLNFFEHDTPTRVTLRTGIEASFLDHYALRFGYARAPRKVIMRDVRNKDKKINDNIFTGGGGASVAPFSADFYIGLNEFGISARIVL
jgi:hypothetical protein